MNSPENRSSEQHPKHRIAKRIAAGALGLSLVGGAAASESRKAKPVVSLKNPITWVGTPAVDAIRYLDGNRGPAHDDKTEATIEQVIKPEMQKIAQAAVKLGTAKGSQVTATQVTKGITEISGSANDNGENIDVVMRDFPGTKKPNPQDILAIDLSTNTTDTNNPKGPFAEREVMFSAPRGNKYLTNDIVGSIYPVDKNGWTAIAVENIGTDSTVDQSLGSELDTASSTYYVVDGNQVSLGPITTAKDTIPDAENLLPTVIESLK